MGERRESGFQALAIGAASLFFFAVGYFRAHYVANDFTPVYAGAKCLLEGCNPYSSGVLLYPPSTLLVLSPFALFQYHVAWFIWFLLNGSLFVTAVVLVLSQCPNRHRWLATCLGAVLLAGSSQLLILAQPAAFSIGLVAIGTYLFLRDKFLVLGVALLMLSLAVKPQLGGLIVLYLFARGVHRRYSALAMAGALAFLICAGLILTLRPQSANWSSDYHENLSKAVAPGAIDDPRPANEEAVAAINLQTITSIFFADEKISNYVAYAVFAALLVAWAVALTRLNPDTNNHWLAIGTLTVLTLLPIYHRAYDSRFLLLSIPAAVIVFEKKRIVGTLACVLIGLSTVSIQHWAQVILLRHGLLQSVQQSKLLFILLLRESDLRLLLLSGLFLFALFEGHAAECSAIDVVRADRTLETLR